MGKMKFGRWLASIQDKDSELGDLADDFRRDLRLNGLKASDFPCPCSVHSRIHASKYQNGSGHDVSKGTEALWDFAEPAYQLYRGR